MTAGDGESWHNRSDPPGDDTAGIMPARIETLLAIALTALVTVQSGHAADSGIAGHWRLNHELTHEVQPDGPEQRDLFGNLPRTSVSVGGVPLPTGGDPPPAPGSSRDPAILSSASVTIEPDEDELTLVYAGGLREVLERGDDQGLVSRWSRRKLSSRYETTTRRVSQVYELRRDGRLLVTVKLNPDQGATVVHKRVFERAEQP